MKRASQSGASPGPKHLYTYDDSDQSGDEITIPTIRGGNNGGSWEPSSQKIFGLTENFQLNHRFFVVKIKFWGKLQLFRWKNEFFAKKTQFSNIPFPIWRLFLV